MPWYPLGPDFVFLPLDIHFLRLSRYNEHGAQGTVTDIAVSPFDARVILAVDAPSSGGSAMHVSEDRGETWRSLLEPLHHSTGPAFGADLDPTCTAFHPAIPGTVYLGTGEKRTIYRSTGGFAGWSAVQTFDAPIRKILIDPRTSTHATTTLYVATTAGLFRTTNGGGTWTEVLGGFIQTLAGDFPTTGAIGLWAGKRLNGAFHSSDGTSWTQLATGPALAPGASGPLPAPASLSGQEVAYLVDFCALEPQRVYAWAVQSERSLGLFRSTTGPTGPWTRIAATGLPNPWQALRNCVFAVSPKSTGTGSTDVLFFGALILYRSHDGGASWVAIGRPLPDPEFHADFHAIAFAPPRPPFTGTPLLLAGCDGGIASNRAYAAPGPISASVNLNAGTTVDTSTSAFRNLNHGKAGSALYGMATDARISHLSYIGCVDTGLARGSGGLGWRTLFAADAGVAAAAPGPAGVDLWFTSGGPYSEFPSWLLFAGQDTMTGAPGGRCQRAPGLFVGANSNLFVDATGHCIGGLISYGAARTLGSAIAEGTAAHEFTLDSLDGVTPGTTLMFEPSIDFRLPMTVDKIVDAAARRVRVLPRWSRNYAPGTPIRIVEMYVGRIDRTGATTPISQNLGLDRHTVFSVAAGPGASPVVACATHDEIDLMGDLGPGTRQDPVTTRLWTTSGGTATASTWSEATAGRPADSRIANVAVDAAGTVLVLLRAPIGGTPLYRVAGGAWTAETCSGVPSSPLPFGRLIAHPTVANRLFAVQGAHVYDVVLAGGTWTWTDITGGASDGLPGTWVYDLWAGNIDRRPGRSKVMLRAAVATRGVYETDITPGATAPALAYYLRDNAVDQGWLDESPSGVPNPRQPAESVWHWQCADIKVDARRPEGFFQTDPEYGSGLPSFMFDVMRDYSEQLPRNTPARVHVAVRNRSRTASTETAWLWVLWTRAGAGLRRLGTAESAPDFDFWGLFTPAGINHALLPSASRWKQVAPPAAVTGVSADRPLVVTLPWTIPDISLADLGHFCLIAILHSPSRPITSFTGTETNVDAITRRNPQLGQKNLHVIPAHAPLLPRESVSAEARAPEQMMTVEIHNPSAEVREATLLFDLKRLPMSIDVAFHLSSNVTPSAVTGAKRVRGCGCWPFRARGELSPVRYEAGKLTAVEVKGVRLGPDQGCAARLAVRVPPETPPGEHTFDVLQLAGGVVVGGSTYVVVVPDPQPKERRPDEEDRSGGPEWMQRNAPYIMAPPWVRDFVRQRPT